MTRIRDFRLYRTRLRCKKPFQIASGVSDVCTGLVLELRTEGGVSGWGEAVPLPYLTGETVEGCQAALSQLLVPAILGLQPWSFETAHQRMNRVTSAHPSARAAVDLALHDLTGRLWKTPVAELLGGECQPVLTNYSIGLTSADEAGEEAFGLVEEGYHAIKLKVGSDPDEDVRRVKSVRGAIGPEIKLRIDANEGWNLIDASRALTRMEPFNVELVEQPLPRWDLKGAATLRSRTRIPIAADEGVKDARDALRSIEAGAVDIINIKLMKCGGLHPARQIVTLARIHGIQLMVGGMVGESSLAVSAAASLAAAFNFEYADLDADLLLADQISQEDSLPLIDSHRCPQRRPGLGLGETRAELLTLLSR